MKCWSFRERKTEQLLRTFPVTRVKPWQPHHFRPVEFHYFRTVASSHCCKHKWVKGSFSITRASPGLSCWLTYPRSLDTHEIFWSFQSGSAWLGVLQTKCFTSCKFWAFQEKKCVCVSFLSGYQLLSCKKKKSSLITMNVFNMEAF